MLNIAIADEKDGFAILDTFQLFAENYLLNLDYNIWVNEFFDGNLGLFIVNEFSNKEFVKKSLSLISENGMIILNADTPVKYNLSLNRPIPLITYGFNPKSSVTASSVSEYGVQCCIQREIKDFYGNIIEPQEFYISPLGKNKNVYNLLSVVSILLLLGNKF
ncbi:MAG: hypothetical protein FWD82_02760 [Defluviitaleaceae bacterium]|nr:hypothetical protein [Defluviitaleaceae bacterium]